MGITNKKMRITLPWALDPVRDERGIALVVALLVSALLLLLGGHFMTASMTEKTIASNEVNTARAFYLAEAGVQHAKKSLEALDLSAVLNGTPVFAGGNAVNLAGGNYAVQVTNNIAANGFPRGTIPADLLGSATVDDDDIIVLTSTAAFRNSTQIVETVLQKTSSIPTIPGAVVQVSNGWNDLDYGGGTISGLDESGTCGNQTGAFHRGTTFIGDGPGTLTGTPPERAYDSTLDNPIWNDPNAVVAMIEGWMNDPAAVTITANTPPATLGTAANPQITVWDPTSTSTNGGASFTGYGILIMVGRVNLKTSFEFHGLIVAYGGAEMSIEGTGSQVLHGALLAADNGPPSGSEDTEVGVWSGATVNYNCAAIKQYVEQLGGVGGALKVLSWRPR